MSLVKWILVLGLVSCASNQTTAATVQQDEVKFCNEVAQIRGIEDKLGHPASLASLEAAEDAFCKVVLAK